MKILFVRHGESVANAERTIGAPDTRLSEAGLEQARVLGQDLRDQDVTMIVCSSFIRAQQTAEVIAGELGIPVHDIVVINELHERRMGELEGQPKRHPTEFFYRNDTDLGFESQEGLIARLELALGKVRQIAGHTRGTTVVVGHATSGFYLLQIAHGKKRFVDFDPVSQMSNAEFTEIPEKE